MKENNMIDLLKILLKLSLLVLGIVLCIALIFGVLFLYVIMIMWSWNILAPLFGGPQITIMHSAAIFILSLFLSDFVRSLYPKSEK